MTDPRLTIGANMPPVDERLRAGIVEDQALEELFHAALVEGLAERHAQLLARFDALLASFGTLPERWRDEETQGKAQELLKMMREASESADAQRRLEKAPFERLAARVDSFFKIRAEPFDRKDTGHIAVVRERLREFLEWKKDQEKRAREAKAAARKKEAEEAAAAVARKEAERQAKLREEAAARARAEAARKEAARAKFMAEKAQRRAQRLRKAEAYLAVRGERRRKADEAAQLERQEAERRAQAERDRQAAVRAEREAADAEAHRLRLQAANSRRSADASDRRGDAAAGQARTLEREATKEDDTRQRLERQADRAEAAANASPAEMSRTRGEHGSVGSLGLRWVWRYEDPQTGRGTVPLDQLRRYIHPDAIDAAISKFVADGGRELPGVRIYQDTEARVK